MYWLDDPEKNTHSEVFFNVLNVSKKDFVRIWDI